ncbi:hypothetical protein RJ035_006290 [Blastomyces gilchristii]
MSLFSPSASPISSTKRLPRNTHTYTKSATTAATNNRSRRVYGKREVDAPRAVLEREHNNVPSKAPVIANERQEVEVENMITALGKGLSALQLDVNERTVDVDRDEEDVSTTAQSDVPGENEAQGREQPMVEIRISVYNGVQREAVTHERDTNVSKSLETVKSKRRPRRSSGWIEDLKLNSYVRPILKEATSPISSRGVQSFASWARRAGDMFTVEKIAEGSYGEVYQLRLSKDISKCNLSKSRLARLKVYKDGVFKIIPLRAQRGVGSKKFTTVQEIVSEVQLLKLLDSIPGFARFREVHVVQGRFPDTYQQAWTQYKQTNASECFNPDPSKAKSYPDTQLWAVLEMDNAGCELEKFPWSSIFQVYDIFWGVALALARAEQFAAFEHRDLHLGNICIKPTKKAGNMSMGSSTSALEGLGRGGRTTGFGLSGLETTIIDYSLSRAELQALNTPDGDVEAEAEAEAGSENPTVEIAWSDLDKRQIFGAIGQDADEKLLRDTYRFMRSEVYHQENLLCPTQPPSKPRQWKHYNPRTNLIWLSFLLQMLLKKLEPPCPNQGQTAEPLQLQLQLQQKQLQRAPLTPRPANHKLHSNTVHHGDDDSPFRSRKKKTAQVKRGGGGGTEEGGKQLDAVLINKQHVGQLQQQQLLKEELTMRLQTTADMLSVESGIGDLYCAGDLVAFALGSGWLDEGDFLC